MYATKCKVCRSWGKDMSRQSTPNWQSLRGLRSKPRSWGISDRAAQTGIRRNRQDLRNLMKIFNEIKILIPQLPENSKCIDKRHGFYILSNTFLILKVHTMWFQSRIHLFSHEIQIETKLINLPIFFSSFLESKHYCCSGTWGWPEQRFFSTLLNTVMNSNFSMLSLRVNFNFDSCWPGWPFP